MQKLFIIGSIFFITFQSQLLTAQIDTSFWFAAPWVTPDHWWKDNIKLHICTFAAPSTTVRVYQPAATAPNKYDTTIIIPANATFDYTFWRDKTASLTNFGFDSLETRPANTVVPYGLHVSSSSDITVVYDVITRAPSFLNPETYSLKGRNALGTQFYCPFQTQWNNRTFTNAGCGTIGGDLNCDGTVTQPKQQINIVATTSNTTVWILPACNVVGHLANVSYSVLLNNPGDAYTVENAVQSTTVAGQNLSGTYITSDKPIAVTVNDDSVQGVTGCFDLIGDQVVPIDVVGTDYAMPKGNMNAPEFSGAYIVATQNATQLTIDDGAMITTTVINQGNTYYYKEQQALTYIHSDKPVYCLHVTGMGCEMGEELLPPLTYCGSDMVSFSRNTPQSFFLDIVCKSTAINSFTLNDAAGSVNVPIAAASFSLVPGTAAVSGGPFFGASINLTSTMMLPLGSYTVANSADVFGLGIRDGGAATGGLYHYLSAFLRRTTVTATTVAPICASTRTLALTGSVTGAVNTGTWTTNGTGTFAPYSSTFTSISTTYSLSASDSLLPSLKFYLTSVGNCRPVQDSINVSINQSPVILISNGLSMCKNTLLPIVVSGTITNALSGAWSGGNGNFSPGLTTTYTPVPADLSAGTISLTLNSQGSLPGCLNTSKTVTVSFLDPPSIATTSLVTICSGNTATLLASGPATFSWSTGASGSSLTVSPVVTTVYTVTATAVNLCQNQAGVTVSVNALPSLSITASNTICQGSSVTLTAVGALSYTWSSAVSGPVFTVTPTGTASYTVVGTDANGCENFTSKTVTVHALPQLTITSSHMVICLGDAVTITVSGASTYTWSTGVTSFSIAETPAAATVYSVTGSSAQGCVNAAIFTQNVSVCQSLKTSGRPGGKLISVYPNPTTGEFMIDAAGDVNAELISETGQVIKQLILNDAKVHRVSLTGIAPGVYYLYGKVNGRDIREKIIVIR